MEVWDARILYDSHSTHNTRTYSRPIWRLCSSVVQVAQLHLPSLSQEATDVYNKFQPVFSLFAKCHFTYDKKIVNEEKANELGTYMHTPHNNNSLMCAELSISSFMDLFRRTFPSASISPKMHMLEDHTMDWVRARNVGFGLLGEQGAESIHARFNSLQRTYASSPSGVERLKNVMKEHLINITPQNVAARPPPAKRRKPTQQEE